MSLRIIEWPDFVQNGIEKAAAITVGVFDGVHIGHQALINKVVSQGIYSTVVTFRENPKKMVLGNKFPGDIFTLKQKLAIFQQMGVRCIILIDFSPDFSKLNGRSFLDLLAEKGRMAFLAIGSNFRCGYRQGTDAKCITAINGEKGIPTEVIPQVELPEESASGAVNSSRVRSAILKGDLKTAAALMGRNFELDVSDIESDGYLYDIRSVNRIMPESGQYPVKVIPGGINALAVIQKGKLRLEKAGPETGLAASFLFGTSLRAVY